MTQAGPADQVGGEAHKRHSRPAPREAGRVIEARLVVVVIRPNGGSGL